MANPMPEIIPEEAKATGAKVVGIGRSDFANQSKNVLVFPRIFRGALDVRVGDINDVMKITAAMAIASLISDTELISDYVIPALFDPRNGQSGSGAGG
jgi:malate dehydrogenase (oxaloacetate-decarboxylating)